MEHSLRETIRTRLDPGASLADTPWRHWLDRHCRTYITADFGERHVRFWDWIAGLAPLIRPQPRVEVWPRGGGKSSSIELGCAYLGSSPHPRRHYVLYVSETQEQSDKHVGAIAAMLETAGVRRALNKYGSSKGWRRAEVRTANGFNVSAFGLDAGLRGIKLDQYRPDLIVFDDIDSRHDTAETVRKKIETITETILPAGSVDCAVVVIQNKVHIDSIVSRLCDGRADFLYNREPATVEKAVNDLQYERVIDADDMPRYRITDGTETWAGQDISTCEWQMNTWGLGAFLREAQQEVDEVEGGLWDQARDIDPFRVIQAPSLYRIGVGVDPNTTSTGDEAGIIVAGISREYDGRMRDVPHGYILADATVGGGPKAWAEAAVTAYHTFRADVLVAERNNGGEMVAINIGTVTGAPHVELVWASRGKIARAEPVQKLYEDGRMHHVGTHLKLEKELRTYQPGRQSPNRMDALVWIATELLLDDDHELRAPTGALADYLNTQ